LLDFLTLLNNRLLDVVLAEAEEFAQFGANDEESARRHGPSDLKEEKSGTRISVGVSRLLKCDCERDELSDGQQNKQCAEKRTHWMEPPIKNVRDKAKGLAERQVFLRTFNNFHRLFTNP
jgi:hypothetical protein